MEPKLISKNVFAVPFDLGTSKGIADLMVPWSETTAFLGISIFYFKWS